MLTMMKSSAWMIVLVLWICSHFWWTIFNLFALVDIHGIVFYHQNLILLVDKWILLSPTTTYQLYWHSFSSHMRGYIELAYCKLIDTKPNWSISILSRYFDLFWVISRLFLCKFEFLRLFWVISGYFGYLWVTLGNFG